MINNDKVSFYKNIVPFDYKLYMLYILYYLVVQLYITMLKLKWT